MKFAATLAAGLVTSFAVGSEPEVTVKCLRLSHQYEVTERAEFEVSSSVTGMPVKVSFLRGYLPKESFETTTPVRVSFALGEPGFVVCQAQAKLASGRLGKTAVSGAGFDPHRIRTALPPPKDYDRFWESAFAEQAAIPPDFVTRPITDTVVLVSCQTVWNTRMYGFLHLPKGEGPFPLQVSVGGGDSLYSPDAVCRSAAEEGRKRRGFLFIHLPPWEPTVPSAEVSAAHGKWMKENKIGGSLIAWNDDKGPRERWYYRCILGCCRLIEYAATRPSVDRSRVYCTGGSTGGGYAVFMAAFSPYIKAAVCGVPNYGNAGGPAVGRPSGEDDRGAHWQTSLYYDAAYCAPRITCPVFMSCGYHDPYCTPETVYCIFNALRCKKVMYDKLENGHSNVPKGYYRVESAWLNDSFGM